MHLQNYSGQPLLELVAGEVTFHPSMHPRD